MGCMRFNGIDGGYPQHLGGETMGSSLQGCFLEAMKPKTANPVESASADHAATAAPLWGQLSRWQKHVFFFAKVRKLSQASHKVRQRVETVTHPAVQVEKDLRSETVDHYLVKTPNTRFRSIVSRVDRSCILHCVFQSRGYLMYKSERPHTKGAPTAPNIGQVGFWIFVIHGTNPVGWVKSLTSSGAQSYGFIMFQSFFVFNMEMDGNGGDSQASLRKNKGSVNHHAEMV